LENIQSYCSILRTLGLLHERSNDLLALQTKNCASALGLLTEIGTIETGKKADLVFIDISEFGMNALLADSNTERILEIVLLEAASQQVSDVMINGEFYVRERHILTYSEEDLALEGQIIFKKLLSLYKQKAVTLPPPAPILRFSPQENKEESISADGMNNEEGFRIVRKEKTVSISEVKDTAKRETKKELSKNVMKIFGEEDT
jgi:hypothetical protein